MSDIFIAGGWFMCPLLICSITIISISIERFWMLQERLVSPSGLDKQVMNLINRDLLDDYQERSIADISSLGDLLITSYKYKYISRYLVESKLEEKSIEIKYKLERNLSMLGVVSTISPLLGLLGTVVGMIAAFDAIKAANDISPAVVAGGISQALLTTAFGLIVAMIIQTFQNVFVARIDKLILDMEEQSIKMLDFLHDLNNKK